MKAKTNNINTSLKNKVTLFPSKKQSISDRVVIKSMCIIGILTILGAISPEPSLGGYAVAGVFSIFTLIA